MPQHQVWPWVKTAETVDSPHRVSHRQEDDEGRTQLGQPSGLRQQSSEWHSRKTAASHRVLEQWLNDQAAQYVSNPSLAPATQFWLPQC